MLLDIIELNCTDCNRTLGYCANSGTPHTSEYYCESCIDEMAGDKE